MRPKASPAKKRAESERDRIISYGTPFSFLAQSAVVPCTGLIPSSITIAGRAVKRGQTGRKKLVPGHERAKRLTQVGRLLSRATGTEVVEVMGAVRIRADQPEEQKALRIWGENRSSR